MVDGCLLSLQKARQRRWCVWCVVCLPGTAADRGPCAASASLVFGGRSATTEVPSALPLALSWGRINKEQRARSEEHSRLVDI